MKVLIEFVEQRVAIMLPIELAGPAAALVAQGRAVTKGWSSSDPWLPNDGSLNLSFITDESKLQPLSERELKLQKEAQDKSSQWAVEYTAKQKSDARVKELETQLETLKASVVCFNTEPPREPTSADYVHAVADDDIRF